MRDLPILMTGAMVRATLEDLKTNTRRIIKPQPAHCADLPMGKDLTFASACPYGPVGRRLWVRETWAPLVGGPCAPGNPVMYRATEPEADKWTWKPSIFMPRWASRITLEVTGIRVERLNDITEEDAVAEGCYRMENGLFAGEPHRIKGTRTCCTSPLYAFERVWESISGPGSWVLNPYVWVIEFRRITAAGGDQEVRG